MIKIYKVWLGWRWHFTLDKESAYSDYNLSGESDKSISIYEFELTPELLVSLLNGEGIMDYSQEILESK